MTTQLIYPYTFQDRTPVYLDQVLFMPEFFSEEDAHIHKKFFEDIMYQHLSNQKIYVEFCSGNGQWIAEMAKAYPEILWIACECRFDRVKKIYNRIKMEEIPNILIAFGYAETFAKFYLPQQSVLKTFVNFPDPWPKKRHAKHRLFQKSFLSDLTKVMAPNSVLTLVTDDQSYLEESVLALQQTRFVPLYPDPYYVKLDTKYGYSFFQDLWIKKGRQNFKTEFTISC